MASPESFDSKVDALYEQWQKLSPTSPESEFETFASYFNKDGTAWLLSMRELAEPSIGRKAIVEGIKKAVGDSQLKERRVVASSATLGGRKIFIEHSNIITVYGKTLDPFPETAVVEFDGEGLILDFKNYSCRSPIVAVIQDITGEGPYERHDEGHCA